MNRKRILTGAIIVVFFLATAISIQADDLPPIIIESNEPSESTELPELTTTYTTTTKTVCDQNGKCTLTLYSGITQVYEDEQWKPIAEARSLLGYYDIVYLEKEDAFNIEVIDFNLTAIELETTFTGHPLDYPEFCTYKSEEEFKCQFKNNIKWDECIDVEDEPICTEQTIKYDMKYEMKNGEIVANDTKFQYKGNTLDKKYSFGGNSTTIILQDADTENLDDTFVFEPNPPINYGTGTIMYSLIRATEGGIVNSMVKFSISSIPVGADIEDANIYLYIHSNRLDNAAEGYDVSVHQIYHYPDYSISGAEWDEETVRWDNRPDDADVDYNSTAEDSKHYFGGTGEPFGWQKWAVTNMVKKAYTDSDSSVSIYFMAYDVFGTPAASDYLYYYTKEEGTQTTLIPYLSITYSAPPPPEDSCTCPESGNWVIIEGDVCTLTTLCDITGGDLYIEDGSLTLTSTATLVADKVFWKLGEHIYYEFGASIITKSD